MAILLRSYNALIPLSHALDTLVLTMFNINGGFMKLYDVRDSTTTLPRSWRPSLDLPQWYRDWISSERDIVGALCRWVISKWSVVVPQP